MDNKINEVKKIIKESNNIVFFGGEVIDESVPDVIITDLAQLLALL